MHASSLARGLLPFVVVWLLAPRAAATWSIVVADAATGEVGVAAATCVNGIDLARYLPVVRMGKGAAAAQALIQPSGANKLIVWNELAKGTAPAVMLAAIQQADPGYQSRQIGIADLAGRTAEHTGTQNAAFAGGVTGRAGTLVYAIQGNILTGAAVVANAEAALLETPGDLADRLMAAMEAARAQGGDGRCSCSPQAPTSCGAPPPSFTKSAHVGFMIIARTGDQDGVCTQTIGCANGDYWLDLNVKGNQTNKPDPVTQLHALFQAWRASWTGRPDHLRSTVTASHAVLPAGGAATGVLTVRLADWQGTPLGHGGAQVTVAPQAGSAGVVTQGAVVDHGDGSYSVPYVAGTAAGKDVLAITVDDGQGPVTLYPFTTVAVAPQGFLQAGVTQVSAAQGDDVPLALAAGSGLAGRHVLVLVSASGTDPGFTYGGMQIPLVLDLAVPWSFLLCGSSLLPGTCGPLDANGSTQAAVVLAPGDLTAIAPGALHFAAITTGPLDFVSAPVTVAVVP